MLENDWLCGFWTDGVIELFFLNERTAVTLKELQIDFFGFTKMERPAKLAFSVCITPRKFSGTIDIFASNGHQNREIQGINQPTNHLRFFKSANQVVLT